MKRKLIALCLCFSLLMAVSFTLSSCNKGIVTSTYDDAAKYRTGAFTYTASLVKNVTIEWYSGAVTVVESEANSLSVTESGENLEDKYKLHYFLREDGTLFIRFWESGLRDEVDERQKKLTVEIPKGVDLNLISTTATISLGSLSSARVLVRSHSGPICAESIQAKSLDLSATSGAITVSTVNVAEAVTVTSASGYVEVDSLSAKSVALAITSGKVAVQQLKTAEKCRVSSVSGAVSLYGVDVASLEAYTASGALSLEFAAFNTAVVDSKSGGTRISLPKNGGTTVYFETNSGALLTEMEYIEALGGGYLFGTGERVLRIKTDSAGLYID